MVCTLTESDLIRSESLEASWPIKIRHCEPEHLVGSLSHFSPPLRALGVLWLRMLAPFPESVFGLSEITRCEDGSQDTQQNPL